MSGKLDEFVVDEEKRVRREAADARIMRIAELNEKYEANDYHGEKGEGANYQVILGEVPVLVSAPHAVCQIRNGVVKERDGMTGGIVEYLCEELGVFGVTRLWEDGDDPNYAEDERSVAYREEIAKLVKEHNIKWVFDIHGCLDKHGFDMDMGINDGQNVACGKEEIERLAENWRQRGVDARIDEKFMARRPYTVSNFVHRETGVNCVQLELNGRVRMSGEGFEKFFQGFRQCVESVTGV